MLLIMEVICLFIFTIGLVWYFCDESTPYYVRVLVVLGFNLSFIYFLILPMDIYTSSINNEKSQEITQAWKIIYYFNFFLCWLILPMVQ
jgi:hypothetical protein